MRLPLRFTRARVVSIGALLLFAIGVFATALREPLPLQRIFVLALMLSTVVVLVFLLARFASALCFAPGFLWP